MSQRTVLMRPGLFVRGQPEDSAGDRAQGHTPVNLRKDELPVAVVPGNALISGQVVPLEVLRRDSMVGRGQRGGTCRLVSGADPILIEAADPAISDEDGAIDRRACGCAQVDLRRTATGA